jgi:hypothetical protein
VWPVAFDSCEKLQVVNTFNPTYLIPTLITRFERVFVDFSIPVRYSITSVLETLVLRLAALVEKSLK